MAFFCDNCSGFEFPLVVFFFWLTTISAFFLGITAGSINLFITYQENHLTNKSLSFCILLLGLLILFECFITLATRKFLMYPFLFPGNPLFKNSSSLCAGSLNVGRYTLVHVYESGHLVIGNELGDESTNEEPDIENSVPGVTRSPQKDKGAKIRKKKKIIAEKNKKAGGTPLGFLIRLSGTYFKNAEKPPKKHSNSRSISTVQKKPRDVFVKKTKKNHSSTSRNTKNNSRISLPPQKARRLSAMSANKENPSISETNPRKQSSKVKSVSARIRFEKVDESIKLPSFNPEERLNESTGNICVVCCDKNASSVFMPCGHGGICDDCALDIFQKTSMCHLCLTVSHFHLINDTEWSQNHHVALFSFKNGTRV